MGEVMNTPKKPTFASVGDFTSRLYKVVRNGHRLLGLSGAFRERLMLAVTGVNDCRYCKALHTRIASVNGLTAAEQDAVLAGDFSLSPSGEREALAWARRWAEAGGKAGAQGRANLEAHYGPEMARTIETAAEAIAIGNYTGNGVDRFLRL
jgi:AhpD family alkylhydroperoxidase